MRNKKYWIILILITVISLFPRAVEVFNPYNYYFDPEQGTEYLVTKSIVIDHQAVLAAHQGGFGGFLKGPGFNYLLGIPFILADGNPFGGRLMMLIISLLTVSLAFVLANRMFGLKTASIISFLLAISPNLKDYAGAMSPPFVIPLLTVFFIYFVFMAFHGQKKFIPVLVFTVGLMTHFEMATAGLLLTLLIITGFYCLIKNTIPKRYYLLSIPAFILATFPLIIFDLYHNFYNTRGVLKMLAIGKSHVSGQLLSGFHNLINNRIDVFGWNLVSTFSPNLIIYVLTLTILMFGIFLFIKDKAIRREQKMFFSYLAVIPIFSFLSLLVYPGITTQQWWLTDLTVIYCFMLGIILNFLWKKDQFKLLIIFVLSILGLAFFNRTNFLYKTQFLYSPNTYIKEDAAVKFVFEDANKKPFGIIVSSKRTQENYDYLIWWNGYTKYHYQPYRTKKGTFYLIIEPDVQPSSTGRISPDSLKSSKIISAIKLPNGFIVEKRIVN